MGETWREVCLECGVKIMVETISQSRGEKGQDRTRPGKPVDRDVA